MGRSLNKLSARTVAALKQPGRHSDGGGLYLSISADGSRRRWVFMFRWKEAGQEGPGRLREMGLGSATVVSLARARELAGAARLKLAAGQNPLDSRADVKRVPTFGEAAEETIATLEQGWRNPKHRSQWRSTLSTYCAPMTDLPIDKVTTEHVLAALQPIWSAKPETASRVRGRIEKVLDAMKAKGHRTGENPARWRGHLDHLLSKRQRLSRGHHKAMPYQQVPAFIARLREAGSVSATCLEFTILTAARSGEAMGCRWEEIDLNRGIWTVPPERMKAGKEHRVPLTNRARDVLAIMREARFSDYVFPGQKDGRPISVMALEMVMRRMKADATVHGFRSAFRDWAAEQSSQPGEVAEAALAHAVSNKVEAAYRRTDLFERRRLLMEDWSEFCGGAE